MLEPVNTGMRLYNYTGLSYNKENKEDVMTTYHGKVKLTVECSLDERVYIKSLAAKRHMTISEFILSYVRKEMPVNRRNLEPNEETRQAMRDVEEEKNLGHAKTVEEFWSAMGIDPNA
jgi:hypothetical protein